MQVPGIDASGSAKVESSGWKKLSERRQELSQRWQELNKQNLEATRELLNLSRSANFGNFTPPKPTSASDVTQDQQLSMDEFNSMKEQIQNFIKNDYVKFS